MLRENQNLGEINILHLPNEASSWHEYAFGLVSDYFGEADESEPDVRTGFYQDEDQVGKVRFA